MAVQALRRGVSGVTRSNFVRGITVEAMRLNTPLKEFDVCLAFMVGDCEEFSMKFFGMIVFVFHWG